ncbi:MAG: DUF3794 and LysM peptidoglycan-binding domain-containing protein, partial [bacterium]
IPGAEENMNAFVDLKIRRISYSVIDERTVEITAVITKFVKVTEYRQVTVITDVTGVADEDLVTELLKIEEVIGETTETTSITGQIDRQNIPENKPPISRVLNATADLVNISSEIEEESVFIEGNIEGGIIYVADVPEEEFQQPVHFLEEEIEFSVAVDIPEAFAGMTSFVNGNVKRVSFNMINEDVVEINVILELFAKVTEAQQVEIITDIISDEIEVERELLRVENVVGEDTEYDTITGNLNVPAEKPDIERVLETSGRITEFDEMVESDGVLIEGVIQGDILYVAEVPEEEFQQPVHYFEGTINFENFVQIPGAESDMNEYVSVGVRRTSFEVLNNRTVEFTVVLEKFAKVTEFMQLEIITEIVEIAPVVDDECPPSYVIYVIQHGDTLWKIARRYKTSVEKIKEANPGIDPNNLQVGQKICVPEDIVAPKG